MRKLSKKEKLAFVALVLILIGVILGSPFLVVGAAKNDWKYDFVGWFLIVTAILSAAGTIIYYTYVKELPETKKQERYFINETQKRPVNEAEAKILSGHRPCSGGLHNKRISLSKSILNPFDIPNSVSYLRMGCKSD